VRFPVRITDDGDEKNANRPLFQIASSLVTASTPP
jgi:hypothetical protein